MLIESHRHTSADLELWRELEEADRAHGASAALARRVERAMEEIARFVAEPGRCYCSVSWGKDSVVLADLVRATAPSVPVVWFQDRDMENPDTPLVRDAYMRRHDLEYHEVGAATRKIPEAVRSFERRHGRRRLTGIRAAESGVRRISLRNLGLSTPRSGRPIGWWGSADVFGYLAANGLPVHPAYAMLGGGRWSRERLRVHSFAGEEGRERGRTEHEREYYGDVLARLGARR